jgi:hypothetical protein
MKLFRFGLDLAFIVLATKANAECWNAMPSSELQEKWRIQEKDAFLKFEADFNGDTKPDLAEIKMSCDKKRVAAFASLSTSGPGFKKYFLAEVPRNQFTAYGLKLAPAGEYRTACSKDYFDCAQGQDERAVVGGQGIELFKYEGVSSIFFWDAKAKKFKRAWISD